MARIIETFKSLPAGEREKRLENIAIFSGSANRPLAEGICSFMARETGAPIELCDVALKRFADGEIYVKYNQNIRNRDVFIIQPTCSPVNDNLMELLLMTDAARRASAASITAVIPYYGYARQDRKSEPRTPISAKLAAALLEAAGINRMVAVDLHVNQIQGFFSAPVDHLYAINPFMEYYSAKYGWKLDCEDVSYVNNEVVLVSTDIGGAARVRAYAKRLKCDIAIIDKRRPSPNVAEAQRVYGDVAGKIAVIVDDMLDTGGSIESAVRKLTERPETSPVKIETCIAHGLLSGSAAERLNALNRLDEIVLTDSIPLRGKDAVCPKIKTVSLAPMLGEAIIAIKTNASISSLFDSESYKLK